MLRIEIIGLAKTTVSYDVYLSCTEELLFRASGKRVDVFSKTGDALAAILKSGGLGRRKTAANLLVAV